MTVATANAAGSGLLRAADRWLQVLRYHRPEQLGRRVWNRVRERLPRVRAAHPSEPPPIRERSQPLRPVAEAIPPGAASIAGADLAEGKFRLLNLSFELGNPIDWRMERILAAPKLAFFHLHYHEYLLALAESDADLVWRTLLDWVGACGDRETGWHPYCVSRRIPVWCRLLAGDTCTSATRERLLESLAAQCRRLAKRFEYDLGGNHLWENAKALAIAGAFFDGDEAAAWLQQGLRCLDDCIAKQVSSFGEHFERSPMYQADLAHGLRDLANWLTDAAPSDGRRYAALAERMTEFLNKIRHPDGGMPLFGDCTLDGDTSARSIAAPGSEWVGDYYVHRTSDGRLLLFDAGDMGPDDLPAHAHADLLGCELSLFGKRALVDAGVFQYSGPERRRFRASAAHNVLTLDDRDLADVWADFRMGRRGHVVHRASGVLPEGRWVRAGHDAYRRFGFHVERIWFLADDGPWFSCHVAHGKTRGCFSEYLHWHPDIAWNRREAAAFTDSFGPRVWWSTLPTCERTESVGDYSPRFHQMQPNAVWRLSPDDQPPVVSAWAISFGPAPVPFTVDLDSDVLRFRWEKEARRRTADVPMI